MFSVDSGIIYLPHKEEFTTVSAIQINVDCQKKLIRVLQGKTKRISGLVFFVYIWLNQNLLRFCHLLSDISSKCSDFPLNLEHIFDKIQNYLRKNKHTFSQILCKQVEQLSTNRQQRLKISAINQMQKLVTDKGKALNFSQERQDRGTDQDGNFFQQMFLDRFPQAKQQAISWNNQILAVSLIPPSFIYKFIEILFLSTDSIKRFLRKYMNPVKCLSDFKLLKQQALQVQRN